MKPAPPVTAYTRWLIGKRSWRDTGDGGGRHERANESRRHQIVFEQDLSGPVLAVDDAARSAGILPLQVGQQGVIFGNGEEHRPLPRSQLELTQVSVRDVHHAVVRGQIT